MDRVKDYRVRILCSDPTQDVKKRLTFLAKKRPKNREASLIFNSLLAIFNNFGRFFAKKVKRFFMS